MRSNIEFNAQGTTLRGWLYRPDATRKPTPLIVMAHGFSATKEMTLDRYAEVLTGGGLSVLVYDHRNTGSSDGLPRFDIDPVAQYRDYSHAITYGETLEGVDKSKIGIWGTSYSGAQVIATAAVDRRVKCVVSQVPLISGFENALNLSPIAALRDVRAMIEADRHAQLAGSAPGLVQLCTADPTEPHLFPGRRSYDYFHGCKQANPATIWENKVTIRSAQYMLEFDVKPYLQRISPTPFLMIVAQEDITTPTAIAIRAYHEALEPKRLMIIPSDHYGSYLESFDITSAAARDWFVQHLI